MQVHKDTITLIVLRPADVSLPSSLSEIAEFIDQGDGIGRYSVEASVGVPNDCLGDELRAIGNDGSFFSDLDDVEVKNP